MKQIKTIRGEMYISEDFDRRVNEAIAEGWTLSKRDVVQAIPPSHINGEFAHLRVWLYAELEKEIITDAERCCENCKHGDLSADMEPCINCSDNANLWEPCEP